MESAGKELCWNFYTKKKNVSFGIFRQIDNFTPGKPVKLLVTTGGLNNNGLVSEVTNATTPTLAQQPATRVSVTSLGSAGDIRASTASKGRNKRVEPPGTSRHHLCILTFI